MMSCGGVCRALARAFAPLPAENFYRCHIMLRTRAMSALSRELAKIVQSLALPEDVTLAVDIAPASLS
jgi:primosomal protein N'